MSYQPHQSEDLTLKPVAGSVPAQGEVMRMAKAWLAVHDAGQAHDYRTHADAAAAILRALVAASPCAVNLGRIRECGPEYEAAAAQGGQQPGEEITEEMLRAADAAFKARDGHAARVVYAGIYRAMRAAAPAAPAAPLTEERILKIAHRQATTYAHRSDPTYHSYAFVPHTMVNFARAILAEVGITLAGTAQKGGEDA